MLLNEDYFDKLDITDDIIAADSANDNRTQFQSGTEFLGYCERHYTEHLTLSFEWFEGKYIFPNIMKQRQYAIDSLFDFYGI